jgi:hypothetical protein
LETASRKETEIVQWKGEDKIVSIVKQDLGSDSGYEGKITAVGV